MALAVCDKVTCELKQAKIYVDKTFNGVSGACEVFYANDEALKYNIKKSLRMIGMIRSQYYKNKNELTD